VRGRWAAGIVPRNFSWVIRDHIAVSERPGGYAPNHRKVRRQEELLWLRAQGFTRVVSLLGSTHNLHAYDELGLEWSRFPMPAGADTRDVLADLYPSIHRWLQAGERLLLHQEELGDRVMGVAAGYLLWSELIPDGPRAITVMEQLLRRQMGTVGRMIVTVVEEVPPLGSDRRADDKSALAGEEAVSAAPAGEEGASAAMPGAQESGAQESGAADTPDLDGAEGSGAPGPGRGDNPPASLVAERSLAVPEEPEPAAPNGSERTRVAAAAKVAQAAAPGNPGPSAPLG